MEEQASEPVHPNWIPGLTGALHLFKADKYAKDAI